MSRDVQHRREYALPRSLTSFVGREREIREICGLLLDEAVRLVTLTGPGGVGKTRLALAASYAISGNFQDGTIFVDLAPLRDPDLVLSAVAQAVGVPEVGVDSLLNELQSFLAHQRVLLVLDNFEHVTSAGMLVTELFTSSRHLKVLVTSRAPLGVSGERQYVVPPLTLPEDARQQDAQALGEFEATRLFVDRATAVKSNFAATDEDAGAIIDMCRRLDGLPLAIELAAAWVKVLPPKELLSRMKPRLPFLSKGPRDVPDRLKTMTNAIQWSYLLLKPAEQAVFRRASVFAGGFTFDAAKVVADLGDAADLELLDLLHSLVDKSLIGSVNTNSDEPRYKMLETIREFGLEQLSTTEELHVTRHRHAMHYWRLALGINAGPIDLGDVKRHDFLEVEFANLGLALDWFLEQEDLDGTVTLLWSLTAFLVSRGHVSVGRSWQERVLAVSAALDPGLRGLVLHEAVRLARLQGDFEKAQEYSTDALKMLEEQAAKDLIEGHVPDPRTAKTLTPSALEFLSSALLEGDDLDRAIRIVEISLEICRNLPFSQHGAVRAIVPHLITLSDLRQLRGELEHADLLLHEAIGLARDAGTSHFVGKGLWERASLEYLRGNDGRALSLYKEAIPIRRQTTGRRQAVDLNVLARLMTDMGESEEASSLAHEALGLAQQAKDLFVTAAVRMTLARIAEMQSDLGAAIGQYESALDLFRQVEDRGGEAEILGALARVHRAAGDDGVALDLQRKQLALWEELEVPREVAATLCGVGLTYLAQGHLEDAQTLCQRALTMSGDLDDTVRCGEALRGLADIAAARGDADRALARYRESIALCLADGERRPVGITAVGLASLEVADGDVGRSARVLGLLQALRATTALSLNEATVTDADHLLDTVQSRLGKRQFAELMSEGRALLDHAMSDGERGKKYEAIIATLDKPSERAMQQLPFGLTPREYEILLLLAEGMSNQEIADRLSIAYKTVESHVGSILSKLDVDNRAKVGSVARRHGLI